MFSEAVHAEVSEILTSAPRIDLSDRRVLISNLVLMHHVIKATDNLLALAIDRTDPGTALNDYFVAHRAEEAEHDVWLADDLRSAGIEVSATLIPRQAVELAGSQYYLLFHVDPVALLGYMAVLEGFPLPLDAIDELERAHGPLLLRTLKHHAVHDVEHGLELNAVIDTLTDRQKALVFESAVQTAHYLASAIGSLR